MLVIFKNCNVSPIPTTSLASTSKASTTTTTSTSLASIPTTSTTTTTSTSLASLWAHFPRHDAQRRFHDISEAPAVFGSSLVKSPFKTNQGAHHRSTICAANRGSPRQGETPNNAQKAAKWRERGPLSEERYQLQYRRTVFCQMLWGFVWQIWSINVVSAHNPL